MTTPLPLPDISLKHLRSNQPRDVLRMMAEALERQEAVDAKTVLAALHAAEGAGGSTIGDGVAVVSARVPDHVTPRRLCAFAHLARPVQFRGVDSHPCDLVFVMLAPEAEGQSYLRDLSAMIRTLRDQDFTARLRAADSADRMTGLFRARDMAKARAA